MSFAVGGLYNTITTNDISGESLMVTSNPY